MHAVLLGFILQLVKGNLIYSLRVYDIKFLPKLVSERERMEERGLEGEKGRESERE